MSEHGLNPSVREAGVERPTGAWSRGRSRGWVGWLISIALALGMPIGAQAQDPPELIAREVFTSTSLEISHPTLSPDGRWIAFGGQPSPDRSSLYVIPGDGGTETDLVQVTRGAFTDSRPGWSPDGRFLYFYSDRVSGPETGTVHIFRLPFDPETGRPTGTPRPISMEAVRPTSRSGPVVSPDGKWVAFAVNETGPAPNRAIKVVPAQGGESRELTRVRIVYIPGLGWSADSRYVYWDEWRPREGSVGGLHRVAIESGTVEQVLPDDLPGTIGGFTGDGRSIVSSLGSHPGYKLMDAKGNIVIQVARNRDLPMPSSFSFDGSSMLGTERIREVALVAQPLNGSPHKVLMKDPCILDPEGWTAMGRVFVYAYNQKGCRLAFGDSTRADGPWDRIYLVNPADGSVDDVSLPVAPLLERAWLFAVHPEGRHVLREGSADDGEAGDRDVSLVIGNLETGDTQPVNTSPFGTWTLGATNNYAANAADGDGAYVIGDRFFFHNIQGDDLKLMAVRPGENPELFWTYPKEIVRPVTDSRPPGQLKGTTVGIRGNLIAWIRSNYDEEVTPETRSTLMVTDVSTDLTQEAATVMGHLRNPMWSRSGRKVALTYESAEGDPPTFAVFELGEDHTANGGPMVLETGISQWAVLHGWSANDEGLIVRGRGVEALDDDAFVFIRTTPGAVPVNITPNETGRIRTATVSLDGTLLVYSADRSLGNTIIRYDLPPTSGGSGR